jgi:hypothetical protein
MTFRVAAALASSFALAGTGEALAAEAVQPRAGVLLSGMIQFPRAEAMTLKTDSRDGSKLTARMGFNGACKGGGLGEAFASRVLTRQTIRVRDGSFSSHLEGRFLKRDVATATVSGSAEIKSKSGGRVISRCKIGEPASVRLAIRSSS